MSVWGNGILSMWTSAIDRPGVMEIVDSTKKARREFTMFFSKSYV